MSAPPHLHLLLLPRFPLAWSSQPPHTLRTTHNDHHHTTTTTTNSSTPASSSSQPSTVNPAGCTCDRYAVKTRCRADLQDAGRVHVGADWETERQRHGIPGAWVSAWCFSTPQTREEAKPLGEKTTNSESPALPVLNWPDSPANSSLTLVASVFLQKASS